MNNFNKTEAAVFSCRLCFMRAFPFISLIDFCTFVSLFNPFIDIPSFTFLSFVHILSGLGRETKCISFYCSFLKNVEKVGGLL